MASEPPSKRPKTSSRKQSENQDEFKSNKDAADHVCQPHGEGLHRKYDKEPDDVESLGAFRFMDLPIELREIVYGYACEGSTIVYHRRPITETNRHNFSSTVTTEVTNHHDLLLVSKTVRLEALAIYYRQSEVHLLTQRYATWIQSQLERCLPKALVQSVATLRHRCILWLLAFVDASAVFPRLNELHELGKTAIVCRSQYQQSLREFVWSDQSFWNLKPGSDIRLNDIRRKQLGGLEVYGDIGVELYLPQSVCTLSSYVAKPLTEPMHRRQDQAEPVRIDVRVHVNERRILSSSPAVNLDVPISQLYSFLGAQAEPVA